MSETLIRNWWVLLLRGLAAVLFAVIAFSQPGAALAALVALWGAYALADGVFTVSASLRAAEQHQRWGLLLLEGLWGIAAGVFAFAWPQRTALVLVYLIAGWAIVTGVLEIAAAVQLRRIVQGEWLLGLGGLLSFVLGLLIAAHPGAGILAWVWMVGGYALLYGVLQFALALSLRRLGQQARNTTSTQAAPAAPGS